MSQQPNIVYIFTDQQSAIAMSCAGTGDLHTPHMDRLAAEGVRFENAYCAFPLCVPSRVSMLSGRMPSAQGVTGNAVEWSDEALAGTAGRLLREAGYRCAWGGKWHAGWGIALPDPGEHDFGFERISGFDDNALPGACAEFLSREHDRPFFLVASFDNPHNICEHSRDQVIPWCEIPAVGLADCPNLPLNHAAQPQEPDAITHWRTSDPGRSRAPSYDPDRWRQFRHAYGRLVEYVDAQVGQILDAIDQSGRAEDTVVIFSSDHGDMNGAHDLNQKWVLYEESSRIPLLIRDPMGGRRSAVDARLVSNGLDLLPTLCIYAGIEPPEGLPGASWRPLIRGESAPWRDYVPVETFLNCPGGGWARMIRTERYAYHLYAAGRHREQLYDLEADPGQMVNRAVESRYAGALHEHRQRLADWCRSTNDRALTHYTHPDCLAVPGLGWVPLED